MARTYEDRRGQRYVMVQFRLRREEHARLRDLVSKLGMTAQDFIVALLRGSMDKEIKNGK